MQDANSNNQKAALKENYSSGPKKKKRKKVQFFAKGDIVEGEASQDPSLLDQAGQLFNQGVQNVDESNKTALAAAYGDLEAQEKTAQNYITAVAGSLAPTEAPVYEGLTGKAAGLTGDVLNSGWKSSYESAQNMVNSLKEQGMSTYDPMFKAAMNKLNAAKSRLGMADGGEVPSGLDEFLSQGQQPQMQGSTQPANEPPGLSEFIQPQIQEEKYGSTGQQALAGLEGAARGIAGPLAPAAEEAFSQAMFNQSPEKTAENIRGRQEVNPVTAGIGEAAGFLGSLATGVGEAALVAKAGKSTAEALNLGAKGASAASKIGASSIKAATEMALIQGGDEVSKMIVKDPQQSAQTALVNIGLAGTLGGVVGGALGSISPLWEAVHGEKAGQMIADFRGRLDEHIKNPNRVEGITKELTDYHKSMTDMADEVYGPKGLKAQEIAKLVPEMNDRIFDQAVDINSKIDGQLKKMIDKPELYPPRLTSKLQADISAFQDKITSAGTNSHDIFNAVQDLKQTMQGYAKFDKFVKPVDEAYDFVRDMKGLSHELRTSLEDTKVWGKAAERQQTINEAFKEYLPSLKDFEKKFTSMVGGETVVDPAKINTYINQLGKPNAELKQEVLGNFIDSSEKYREVKSKTHSNLGLEAPLESTPLNMTKATLKKLSKGAQLADSFVKNGIEGAAKAAGAGVGGALGHTVGHGWLGALLGEKILSPFFKSILPVLAKPMTEKASSAIGLKAASEFGHSVLRGQQIVDRSIKNVFKTEAEVLPSTLMPNEKDHAKIEKYVNKFQEGDPSLMDSDSKLGHYMPSHAEAMSQSSASALQYLSTLKQNRLPSAPLDNIPKISDAQKAEFNRAISIAQQPLIVLKQIKDGNLRPSDVVHLQTMYPELYTKIVNQLTDEVTERKAEGKMIPYKTKMALSMFMGQPLDSTMLPASIQAAQGAVPLPPVQSPQGGHSGASRPNLGATKALAKMPNLNMTPDQARVSHRQLK